MKRFIVIVSLLLVATTALAGVYTTDVKMRRQLDMALGTPMASSGTVDIGRADGNTFHITGTTTITSLGAAPQAGITRTVIFDGALTLTHNASTLVLPGGANITTAAGDVAKFVADTSTKWRCTDYTRAADAPGTIVNGSFSGNATVGSFVMTPQTVTTNSATLTSSTVVLYNSSVGLDSDLAALAAGKLHIFVQGDSGTAGHTVTLGAGTFDGTNNIATFNAENDSLVVIGSGYNGAVLVNNGVVLSN